MNIFARPDKLKADQLMTPHEYLARDTRSLFLYGVIAPIHIRGDIFGPVYLTDMILAMSETSVEPIKLYIDSPGGFISTGFALYDTMKTSKAPVHTIGRSCQSMAAVVLAAGAQGHRYVYKHTRVMLHLPSGSVSGDSDDVAIQSKEMETSKNKIIEALQECGVTKTRKDILKDINREYWMNAEEAVAYGLADHVIQ
jgi:ATP-dependent Clp protease protease subunit